MHSLFTLLFLSRHSSSSLFFPSFIHFLWRRHSCPCAAVCHGIARHIIYGALMAIPSYLPCALFIIRDLVHPAISLRGLTMAAQSSATASSANNTAHSAGRPATRKAMPTFSSPVASSATTACHGTTARDSRELSPQRGQQRRRRSPHPSSRVFTPGAGDSYPCTCALCLGRYSHNMQKCTRTTRWNGEPCASHRNSSGILIFSKLNLPVCLDFQLAGRRCTDTSHPRVHACSGCGDGDHGAFECPHAQAPPYTNPV